MKLGMICSNLWVIFFRECSLSYQLDAVAITVVVVSKETFERIYFSLRRFKLMRLSSFICLSLVNLLASPNNGAVYR